MLARRDYSQQELSLKLRTKGLCPEEIATTLNELAAKGFLNNKRFAENYIHARQQKGYGPLRITLELKMRGLADDLIAELIDITDNRWFIIVQKTWQKKFKNKSALDFKEQAKQMRFLQYRGFTQEQIESIFH